jgi:hypothetical protein
LTKAGVAVYPNPVKDELTIETKEKCGLTIYNVAGEKIIDALALKAGEKQTLETQSWPAGIYVIELTGKERVYTRITKM